MRPIIVGLLYVVAIVCFIEAIMVNSGGGFFDLSALKNNRLTYFLIFCGLLATEIVIALFVNDAFVRPYVGDMLVTLLLCCLCRVIIPANVMELVKPIFDRSGVCLYCNGRSNPTHSA